MLVSTIEVAGSLGVILLAAIIFTNSIEWLGFKLNLGHGAVGSILAAVGTAMPETILPFVAVVFAGGSSHGEEVGLGAILGAPFMLSTLAMFVVGTAVVVFHSTRQRPLEMDIHWRAIGRDVRSFLAVYILAIATAFIPVREVKYAVAAIAALGYIWYVYRHLTDVEDEAGEECPSPLYCAPRSTSPHLALIIGQVVVALVLMMGASYVFVGSISALGTAIGVPAMVLSLIIAPIATELPEKFNSVLWVRENKDTLALGNMTGAMVFQSTIPVSFGMLFTDWHITPGSMGGFISGGIAIVSSILIFGLMMFRQRLTGPTLLIGGLMYLVYLGYLVLVVLPSGVAAPTH